MIVKIVWNRLSVLLVEWNGGIEYKETERPRMIDWRFSNSLRKLKKENEASNIFIQNV